MLVTIQLAILVFSGAYCEEFENYFCPGIDQQAYLVFSFVVICFAHCCGSKETSADLESLTVLEWPIYCYNGNDFCSGFATRIPFYSILCRSAKYSISLMFNLQHIFLLCQQYNFSCNELAGWAIWIFLKMATRWFTLISCRQIATLYNLALASFSQFKSAQTQQ